MGVSKDVTFTKAAFIAHDFSAFIVKGLKNRNGALDRHTYYNKVLNQTVGSNKAPCVQNCQPFTHVITQKYAKRADFSLPIKSQMT